MIFDYATVLKNNEIMDGIFETVLLCNDNMPDIKAGQFINVYPSNPILTLPRPISVCDVNENRLRIIYQVVGKGTKEFSSYTEGSRVKIMYPLGNGFDINSDYNSHVLIGGGLGAAPLLLLAKTLKGKIRVFLGFKDAPILVEEFKAITADVFVATESGAHGEKGSVIDILTSHDDRGGLYASCGPEPMLKAVCEYLREKNANGFISLESRMACGFGVCIGCAVKIKKDDCRQYLKTCTDGPVFNYEEVLWD